MYKTITCPYCGKEITINITAVEIETLSSPNEGVENELSIETI
ncbi:MAG: hypothetical protein ABFD07_02895 [Methanobacterium sp.]